MRDRLAGGQGRIVAGLCIAAGAAFLQPATYNYIVAPMLVTFGAAESASAPLREVPSVASLLVIFVAATLATRMGSRRTISAGAIVLTVGSLLVMAAPNLPVAVAGLAVQSVGATVLLVVPLGVIGAIVTGADARASAFALFSLISPVVFVVLPVVTSLLMEQTSWRVVAAVWAVGGLVSWMAGRRALTGRDDRGPATEMVTPALAGVVCAGLVQVVSHASSDGVLSRTTVVRLLITAIATGALWWAWRRTSTPALDVAILRRRGFGILLVVVGLWCFTALWYYMTLAYEYVFGLSVLVTALLMVPAQVCAGLGAVAAGRLMRRFGLTPTGVWLLVATGASLALSVLVRVDSPLWWPVLITCLYSLASVGAGVPLTNALMDTATPGDEASASAYRQAAIGIGTAVGIAVISALVFATFSASLSTRLDAEGLDSDQAQQIAVSLRTGAGAQQESAAYAVPVQEVESIDMAQREAYLDGMDAHGWAGAALSLATAGLFAWGRRSRR